jgi:hypothetical protein
MFTSLTAFCEQRREQAFVAYLASNRRMYSRHSIRR